MSSSKSADKARFSHKFDAGSVDRIEVSAVLLICRVVPVLVDAETGQTRSGAARIVEAARGRIARLGCLVEVIVHALAGAVVVQQRFIPQEVQHDRIDCNGVLRRKHAGCPIVAKGAEAEHPGDRVVGTIETIHQEQQRLTAELRVANEIDNTVVGAHRIIAKTEVVQGRGRPATVPRPIIGIRSPTDRAKPVFAARGKTEHAMPRERGHIDQIFGFGHAGWQISRGIVRGAHARIGEVDGISGVIDRTDAAVACGIGNEPHVLEIRVRIAVDPVVERIGNGPRGIINGDV